MAKLKTVELRKSIGKVSVKEKDEIQDLFERKNGLIELSKALSSFSDEELNNNNLYERIIKDLGGVTGKFQKWWDEKSVKYSWESKNGFKWEIDFNTCEIFLVKN